MFNIRYNLLQTFTALSFILITGTANAQQIISLQESRELALQNNYKISKANEDVKRATSSIDIAKTAGLPKLDASVSAFYFGKPLNEILPEYGISSIVSIIQPIYTGGKIKYGKEMAKTYQQLSVAQKRLIEANVLFATEITYWQVVLAKEQIKMERQISKQLASHYERLDNQFNAGLIYKNDVLRAKVQQNENDSRLQMAENALLISKKKLAQLIGMEENESFDVEDSLAVDVIEQNIVTEAQWSNRPELELVATSIKKGELEKKLLQADRKPTIGVSLNGISSFGPKGINFSSSDSNSMVSHISMLSVKIPIFDWGSRAEKVRQQEFTIRSTEFEQKEIESQIAVEAEQAILELQLQAKNIQLMEASLVEAEENLKLSNDRFEAGTITGEDVLIAETLWQKAYSSMLFAKVKFKIAEANYRKAIGKMK